MKVFFWGLVAVACCYAVYGGMMSAYQWFQVHNVVDEVLQPRNLRELTTTMDVKRRIMREAAEAGVPLAEREVNVVSNKGVLAIQVAWTFPMIVYKGESVLAIPLSVKKRHIDGGRAHRSGEPALASAISFWTRARSSAVGATLTKRSHARTAPATSFFAS
jgi:nitrogen-specific signal transduction histidine kinase